MRRSHLRIDYSRDPEYRAELARVVRRLGASVPAYDVLPGVATDVKAMAALAALGCACVAVLMAAFLLNG